MLFVQFKDKIISALIEQAPKVRHSWRFIFYFCMCVNTHRFRLLVTSYLIYSVARSLRPHFPIPPLLPHLLEAQLARLLHPSIQFLEFGATCTCHEVLGVVGSQNNGGGTVRLLFSIMHINLLFYERIFSLIYH